VIVTDNPGVSQGYPYPYPHKPLPADALTVALCGKNTQCDQSEVTNGYGILYGCENGIFENVPTKEGE